MNEIGPGEYEVYWQNKYNTRTKCGTMLVNEYMSLTEFEETFKLVVKHFGCFVYNISQNNEGHYKLITSYKKPKKRHIAIVDLNNEKEINILIDEGYSIREFTVDKCILQLKDSI